ncbi:MAG: winged helix-turn-helix transcriptional regulator [Deltaproteobacteria bacterium]|nr:winged helix-turn-helix transcriptional regulator [Deltaproteobacteria bacterium]MBZ0219802.1 metalloregulator ArsR/SmtB family transcription factor [Deltaproteobacteria bacterium]
MKKEVFKLQAEICKTLANPKRLEIINALRDGELPVAEIVERLAATSANVSQHLAVLRQRRVVTARREGANIYYRINNPKIIEACSLMKAVLLDQLEENEKLAVSIKKEKHR